MGCLLYSSKLPTLGLLFHLLVYNNPASGTPFQYCTNYLGEEIEDGVQYIPSADDLCYKCTCDGGYPVACSSVFCSPPDCKLYEVIEDECCKFICLEAADEPDIINNNDTGEPVLPKDGLEYLDSANLPLRLVASTVTSFLILALLLFMVHRLRQRRTLIMLRRLNAERQEEDTVAYLPQMDNIDIGIEFPPYEDPPPPYTPPKPPYFPEGEAPPPYDDTNGNVINTGNSMPTSEWIGGNIRQCNGQVNEVAADGDVHSVNHLSKDGEQMNSECNESSHHDGVQPLEDVQLSNVDTMCMCNRNASQNLGKCGSCPACDEATIFHNALPDQVGSTVHSEMELDMASGVNSLPSRVLDNSKACQHKNLDDTGCQNTRPRLTAFSHCSGQSYQPHISESVFINRGPDSSEHSADDYRNDSTSTPDTHPQVSTSSGQQSSSKSCCVNRSGSLSSETSLLSICSETGERKRPPAVVHQEVLQPDVKYPETPLCTSHLLVHHSSTAAPETVAAGFNCSKELTVGFPNSESEINYDSVENCSMNHIPSHCETIAEQCSLAVDDPDSLELKQAVGEHNNGGDQEKTNVPADSSENAVSLRDIDTTADSPNNSRPNPGFLHTRARKGRPVSVPNSVEHLKYRFKSTSRSHSGQDSVKERDIPNFKQYGFIDKPEVLFACKNNGLYPEDGDTVLSAQMFEKLHHVQESDRHANRKRNHNSPGNSSKTKERSNHNSRKLSLSPEHVSKERRDCAVNIDSHQCSEPFKVNFLPRCVTPEQIGEPNKLHGSRHRRKHKYTKGLKSNSRNAETTMELNPLEPGGTRDILNNNLLDNYHALNTTKIITDRDKASDHQVDNLSSQRYINSDISCEER